MQIDDLFMLGRIATVFVECFGCKNWFWNHLSRLMRSEWIIDVYLNSFLYEYQYSHERPQNTWKWILQRATPGPPTLSARKFIHLFRKYFIRYPNIQVESFFCCRIVGLVVWQWEISWMYSLTSDDVTPVKFSDIFYLYLLIDNFWHLKISPEISDQDSNVWPDIWCTIARIDNYRKHVYV